MVRREFTGATLLTIAHRLNTIMDSDKILVLEQGYMREEGAPDSLISQGGLFAELYHAAGH
jgi:ABC-type multidrug transport system fused ATPase/permease subunit